jgi:hypothetical protein
MITVQFIPYSEIENLTSIGRIRKLLSLAKDKKIIVLSGRLKRQEEKELIRATMEEIDDNFKGIELAVVEQFSREEKSIHKLKNRLASFLLGDRRGFTIIGPASIVSEIKKDPDKIQLLAEDNSLARNKSLSGSKALTKNKKNR